MIEIVEGAVRLDGEPQCTGQGTTDGGGSWGKGTRFEGATFKWQCNRRKQRDKGVLEA